MSLGKVRRDKADLKYIYIYIARKFELRCYHQSLYDFSHRHPLHTKVKFLFKRQYNPAGTQHYKMLIFGYISVATSGNLNLMRCKFNV